MRAKDNPFRIDRVHQIQYRFRDLDWEKFLNNLLQFQYRCAIVGKDGSGKSLLMMELISYLKSLHFNPYLIRLNNTEGLFKTGNWYQILFEIKSDRMILIDGAEQLSSFLWQYIKMISKRSQGLIITSHRAGLLPTAIDCSTDIKLFKQIVNELLIDSAQISDVELSRLFDKYHGNLREALRELYDQFALRE